MPEELLKKPIFAGDLHKYLNKNDFNPTAVVVDNTNAKVKIYFEKELDENTKKRLMEAVLDYYNKHIGVKKE